MASKLLNVRRHQIDQLEQHLSEAVRNWCADWDFPNASSWSVNQVSAADLHSFPDRWSMLAHEQLYVGSASPSCGDVAAAVLALAFTQHALPASNSGPVAMSLAKSAAADLIQRLLTLFGLYLNKADEQMSQSMSAIPQQWCSRWSGVCLAKLTWDSVSLAVCISAELVALLAPASPNLAKPSINKRPLTPVPKALGEHPITHSVELSPQPIRLDDLISMRIGDVLTTQHLLGQPILLLNHAGQAVLRGDLGQVAGHYALSVSSLKSPAP